MYERERNILFDPLGTWLLPTSPICLSGYPFRVSVSLFLSPSAFIFQQFKNIDLLIYPALILKYWFSICFRSRYLSSRASLLWHPLSHGFTQHVGRTGAGRQEVRRRVGYLLYLFRSRMKRPSLRRCHQKWKRRTDLYDLFRDWSRDVGERKENFGILSGENLVGQAEEL